MLAAAGKAGYRVNLTPSMPLGLWRVVAAFPADYHRGQAVAVCPPVDAPFLPRGSCPLGMQPLLKEIVALPGDVVTVTFAGVSVNGDPPLPHSPPLAQTLDGQPLPQWLGTWRLTGYWLYGAGSPRSFDSRYFGAVPAGCLQGVAYPVVLF
jgi:conjugative transfer signal peptidase TraF